jgi:hypothetical protein
MTPVHIEVLMHCHYRCEALPSTPAFKQAVEFFMLHGLIEPCGQAGQYRTTRGGQILVDALCAVPLPVKDWVMVGTQGRPERLE